MLDNVERLLSAKNLALVIKTLFEDVEIVETEVKRGSSSSAQVYVPGKYKGQKATVLIWKNKNENTARDL